MQQFLVGSIKKRINLFGKSLEINNFKFYNWKKNRMKNNLKIDSHRKIFYNIIFGIQWALALLQCN